MTNVANGKSTHLHVRSLRHDVLLVYSYESICIVRLVHVHVLYYSTADKLIEFEAPIANVLKRSQLAKGIHCQTPKTYVYVLLSKEWLSLFDYHVRPAKTSFVCRDEDAEATN